MSDFKINPALCFKPEDIIRYLGQQVKDDTLHNELVATLVIRLVIEKIYEWNDYLIYFHPKDNRQKELIEAIGSTIKIGSLPEFLDKNVEQNSPYDVLFVRPNHPKEADVRPIQLKRFGIRLDSDRLTELFIDYLDKLNKKYSPVRASLFVYLENKGTLNFGPIVQHIKENGFPFEELTMFSAKPNGDAHVCQVYPSEGDVTCVIFSKDEVEGRV